jgi:ribosomal-protein-alanine N-acetyltransferase
MIRIRPATVDDAPALAKVYAANRRFLAPWEPIRDEDFFTPAGQHERIAHAVADEKALMCLITEDAGIVGMISLTEIARGPAQSAHLGYWVSETANGRGIATQAVRLMFDVAFGQLALHRLQAGTLLHNLGSQKVLERTGFERIGVARSYLNIAGQWQDLILFQRLTDR